jgi:hypothetical protein
LPGSVFLARNLFSATKVRARIVRWNRFSSTSHLQTPLLREDLYQMVLQRPVELARLIRTWHLLLELGAVRRNIHNSDLDIELWAK